MKEKLLICFLILCSSVSTQQKITSKSIPFIINEQNTIIIEAIFNEKDTLHLNFDTGTTELVLTNDALKNKLKSIPKLYNTYYNLKLGNATYKTKVYDAALSGHGTDGRFGWDLFKDKVVEINYDKKLLIIHATLPNSIEKNRKFTKLAIEFYKDLFLIQSMIKQNGISIKDFFLFDTGYQRTVMLDNDLLKHSKFPIEKMKFVNKVIMKGAQGNEIPVITSILKVLKIGKHTLKNIPIQQITTNKPLKNKSIHILGNEVLKRFTVFLDFQNNFAYLKPNHLFKDNYTDQKENSL